MFCTNIRGTCSYLIQNRWFPSLTVSIHKKYTQNRFTRREHSAQSLHVDDSIDSYNVPWPPLFHPQHVHIVLNPHHYLNICPYHQCYAETDTDILAWGSSKMFQIDKNLYCTSHRKSITYVTIC